MHHPRHAHTIWNLRIAALLLCVVRLLIPAAVVVLLISAVDGDKQNAITGLILIGTALLLTVLHWMFASSAKCPLCMMPVLLRKGCSKHRHAKQLFGSYRLRAALAILFKGRFRCPYCNEPTVLRLKPVPAPARR